MTRADVMWTLAGVLVGLVFGVWLETRRQA